MVLLWWVPLWNAGGDQCHVTNRHGSQYFYPAEWALRKGLYTQVFDSTEELDEAVQAYAEQLCGYNPEAMAEMKHTFWAGTENWDNYWLNAPPSVVGWC